MRHVIRPLVLCASLFAATIAGCESVPSSSATSQPAYQPADGRNLAPALQPYAADPQFPYNLHQGGGGARR